MTEHLSPVNGELLAKGLVSPAVRLSAHPFAFLLGRKRTGSKGEQTGIIMAREAGWIPVGRRKKEEADDGVRTRDPQLGKLMLYQLSYVRVRLNDSGIVAE